MYTFATLHGSDFSGKRYQEVFEKLCEIAKSYGFDQGDADEPVQADQIDLSDWTLTQKGSGDGKAAFILSVVEPKVPSCSPIPIRKTIDGPLFSVRVMSSCFGIWYKVGDELEITEKDDYEGVGECFDQFIQALRKHRMLNEY